MPVALDLAQRIGCERMNALVGLERSPGERAAQLDLAAENVRWAADQAAPHGIDITIEAVNTLRERALPRADHARGRGASSTRSTARTSASSGTRTTCSAWRGTWSPTVTEFLPRIAHIQIADAPGRGEPGTGEINFPFVLDAIDALGYEGWIGLEYNPTTATTEESLAWMPERSA